MNPAATNLAALPQPEEEEMPSASVIGQLKAQLPGRDLHRIEMKAGENVFVFVMTGPTRTEWKKYRDECTKGAGDFEKLEMAIERAAMAQIRWPAREEVKDIFELNPGLIQHFAENLNKLAGAEVESTAKKL
jgi:hypothetical protein